MIIIIHKYIKIKHSFAISNGVYSIHISVILSMKIEDKILPGWRNWQTCLPAGRRAEP